jgi:CoA:oxalate CoA-transferase
MLSCQLALLENAYARFLNSTEVPVPLGSRHPSIAPFESYSAADSDLVIALGTNAEWPRCCGAIEAPGLADDPRFKTTPLRLKNRNELEVTINGILKTKPRQYWLDRLLQANIACGPKSSIAEFASSDYAAEISAFEKIPVEDGDLRFVRNPLVDSGAVAAEPAPRLGEHTVELLGWAGYSAEQIADLKARHIINYP